MPRLVKGGKYIFGWCNVSEEGEVPIPPEACQEYELPGSGPCFLFSGSKTSGGFALSTLTRLGMSPLGILIQMNPELAECRIPEGEALRVNERTMAWVHCQAGRFRVSPATLRAYSVDPGDRLLAVRGSGLALGFISRGRIFEEALRHTGIPSF